MSRNNVTCEGGEGGPGCPGGPGCQCGPGGQLCPSGQGSPSGAGDQGAPGGRGCQVNVYGLHGLNNQINEKERDVTPVTH